MSKTILVTGGTKGIGKAIIYRFAQEGYKVLTCARNPKDLDSLSKDFRKEFPDAVLQYIPVDLSNKDEVISFGKWVHEKTDHLDVLVNNAGTFIPGKIQDEEDLSLEFMMKTNLYSAYYLTRAILPLMLQKKTGDVFNVCSVASLKAYENGGSYSISKFALYGFSQNLREELKETGIRVVSVMPGATFTSSWEGSELPIDRFMKSSDVADVIWSAHGLSRHTVVEDLVLRPQLGDI